MFTVVVAPVVVFFALEPPLPLPELPEWLTVVVLLFSSVRWLPVVSVVPVVCWLPVVCCPIAEEIAVR